MTVQKHWLSVSTKLKQAFTRASPQDVVTQDASDQWQVPFSNSSNDLMEFWVQFLSSLFLTTHKVSWLKTTVGRSPLLVLLFLWTFCWFWHRKTTLPIWIPSKKYWLAQLFFQTGKLSEWVSWLRMDKSHLEVRISPRHVSVSSSPFRSAPFDGYKTDILDVSNMLDLIITDLSLSYLCVVDSLSWDKDSDGSDGLYGWEM